MSPRGGKHQTLRMDCETTTRRRQSLCIGAGENTILIIVIISLLHAAGSIIWSFCSVLPKVGLHSIRKHICRVGDTAPPDGERGGGLGNEWEWELPTHPKGTTHDLSMHLAQGITVWSCKSRLLSLWGLPGHTRPVMCADS